MPPFRELNPSKEDDLIRIAGEWKPDIIWVGISTPKQELFTRRMLPRLETRLRFEKGAAFDFHAGPINDGVGQLWLAGVNGKLDGSRIRVGVNHPPHFFNGRCEVSVRTWNARP